jgi:hypothetical protein
MKRIKDWFIFGSFSPMFAFLLENIAIFAPDGRTKRNGKAAYP